MTDTATATDANEYGEMERQTLDAFTRWHAFHESLIDMGGFANWLSGGEHSIDLVTFFALDSENTASYKQALSDQAAFLDGLKQMLDATRETLEGFEAQKQS